MRISLVILTFNRMEIVKRSLDHSLRNAGYPIDQLVWVDNGSTDGVRSIMSGYNPHISILSRVNEGISRGNNRGLALATGEYVVTIGSDMLMLDGWLARFAAYHIAIPSTGVACITFAGRRRQQPIEMIRGLPCQRGFASGCMMVRRELLTQKIGYFREDFGLYGHEDVEWERRALRVCEREALLAYAIPGPLPYHFGTMGAHDYDGKEDPEYHALKAREINDPAKLEIIRRCRRENYPYYNPYA